MDFLAQSTDRNFAAEGEPSQLQTLPLGFPDFLGKAGKVWDSKPTRIGIPWGYHDMIWGYNRNIMISWGYNYDIWYGIVSRSIASTADMRFACIGSDVVPTDPRIGRLWYSISQRFQRVNKISHTMWYWLVVSTPLKNILVSWGYYSQYMEKHIMFQTTNQDMKKKMTVQCCALLQIPYRTSPSTYYRWTAKERRGAKVIKRGS